MEKLVLADGTELEIQPGATQRNIVMHTPDIAGLAEIVGALTKENLKAVKFTCDGTVVGEYADMVLEEPHLQITMADGFLIVGFGIREMTLEELQQKDVATVLTFLTDEQAVTVKGLHPDWENDPDGYPYSLKNPEDLRRKHNDRLWKLQKDHKKQADHYPGADPTLWSEIVEGHAGTEDDPIPVPDSVTTSGFEYEYGKYYNEDGKTYICKRGGVADPEAMYGEKVKLNYPPSALIGQYFEVAEEGK